MKKQPCNNPTCQKEARCRGLCLNCYQAAFRLIKMGRTTWLKLEALDKASHVVSGKHVKWLLDESAPTLSAKTKPKRRNQKKGAK